MALWKASVSQRTLSSCPNDFQLLLHNLLFTISAFVIINNVGYSHAIPASAYLLESKAGAYGGGGSRANGESGSKVIYSVETSVVSFGVLISLVVFAVLCTGGCCLKIFGKRRGEEIPTTGFSNPVADLGSSATTISPIDVRALEMNPIIFEPLPAVQDLTPGSTNFYNSLHRIDSSVRYPRHLSPDSQSSYLGIGAATAIVPSDESNIYAHDWFDEPYRNFPRGHVEYVKEVGKGWFGKVIEAEAEDIVPFTKKLRVLVKVLREDATGTEQMRFLDESRLYRDANHGNVLKLLGHSIETLPFLLIMEHCPQGDLKSFLIANVARAELLNTQGALVRMALDIAKGLEWMASADFIHKDLAARNCQVGSEGRVIIGDYGLATQTFRDDYYWGQHVAIPLRWLAPETLHCTINTIQTLKVLKSSNVWTFGVVVWEICEFGKLPYYELSDDDVISRVITDRNYTLGQLTRPGLMMRDQLYKIMLSCWNPRFESRPTMSTIVEQMELIFSEINSNSATSTPSTPMTPTVSGVRSTKDDFDKRWEDLGIKINSPRGPEEVYSPSWDGSPNNGGANANITGSSKKKSVTFVGMEEELPNVRIKVGNTFSVQQTELPVAFKHPGTPQATILESQSSSLSQINHNHIEKSLKNTPSVSETRRDTNTSSLVLLPQSNTTSKEVKEIVDVWKVSGDTEDEGWRQRIELGEISQKVQEKSQTVQDLMVLTHVEPSELSDPESLVIISQGQIKQPHVTINPSFNSSSLSLNPSSVKTSSSSVISNNSDSLQKTKTETPLKLSPTNVSKLMNSPNSSPKSSEGSDSFPISTNTVSKLEPSSSAHSALSSTTVSSSTGATGELSKFEFTALSSVLLEENNTASSDVSEKTNSDLNSLDCSNNKNNTSNTEPFLNSNNAAADLNHTRSTVTTNLDDCSGLSMDFDSGNKLNLDSKASFHRPPEVPESNLNPFISISSRIDVSINSNSETHDKVGSTLLTSSGIDACSDLASKEIHSSSSTSHNEQLSEPNDDIVNIQKSLSVSPLQCAVSNAQRNLSNGGSGKRESSSFHVSDVTKTLTSHTPNSNHETIINLISPTPNNMVIVKSIQNGVAKPNSRMTKTEAVSEKVISADGHSPVVSFVLTNKEIPAKMMGEGISEAAKNKKFPFRLRKTSTPNKSPGLDDESCGTIDSDFFQRSDDIFEDFSMELSEHLSPIKKTQGAPQSLLTSNVSANYNHFQVLMGPSEDLGLKPYQRVTTQIEREMSRSNNGNRDFSDYQNEPTGNTGTENNDLSVLQSETFSDAHSSDMWYCTDESNLEQPVKSKSGFNDIFGAGRPHGDTPVFQGTFTPEAESSAEKENNSSQSKPAVARKLLFQSDASFWDRGGSANSTGNVVEANDVSRILAQNPAGTWDTFKSAQSDATMNLTSSYEKDSQSDKCVTVLKKPYVEVSSDEKVRVLDDDDPPNSEQSSFQPQFKLGHGTGNAQTTSLGLTGNETKGKDTFVEDIETAVEEFGSLVLADLEEEGSKVEVIKETREDESFDGKRTGSSIIRVPRHAFSETRGGTSSTEGDSLIIPSYDGLDEHSESEVSVLNASSNISKEFSKDPEEKSLITDLDDSDNGEEDENDDENICREFVPSKWNQNLAPVKPAIKSPEQQKAREASSTTTPSGSSTFEKSGLKKSVSFERVRKKTQLVYEYPPPPPASSDSDDEEKHAKVIGTAGGSLSSSLDWELQPEDVENTDVPLDDWEEEFTQSRTDNPMDMYRFSGFENFQVRPSAEPFAFHRVPSTLATSAQSLESSAPPLTNFLPHSSVASAATIVGTSTLGELRHTRSRLKLDLSKGEASLLDSERLTGGDITKLATTTVQQVDSGVGSISSTNVSPFTQCDNYNN